MSKTCSNCLYSRFVKSEKEIGKVDLTCHRYPPVPVALSQQTPQGLHVQIMSVYPPVQLGESCGEFMPAI